MKSPDFDDVRVMLCVNYMLISYANELHEEIDRKLNGHKGLLIGQLKHKSHAATKALEDYDKEYLSFISDGGGKLTDANIEMTSKLDIAMKQNMFFYQEGYKALRQVIREQTDKTIYDKEELERGYVEDDLLIPEKDRKAMLQATLKQCRKRLPDFKGDVMKGVEVGFNAAVDFMNKLYKES